METNALFAAALGLTDPWYVSAIDLDPGDKRLEITLDFRRGGTFPCPERAAAGCKAHDTAERRWRHLDFFQFRTELVARTPRVACDRCGVHAVHVPWARPGSGFTLLLRGPGPRHGAADADGRRRPADPGHDTRLWHLVKHHVREARARRKDKKVRRLGIDETSSRRGHNYISLSVDLDRSQLLFATPGKDADTVTRFKEDLVAHGGRPDQIEEACCDRSAAFLKGLREEFPDTPVTLDKFHLVPLVNEAVDRTRRAERAESAAVREELKGHRYDFLRNPDTMTNEQLGFVAEQLERSRSLKTARAFHLKLVFLEVFTQPKRVAAGYLDTWCRWAVRSRLPEMVRVARTIREHWDGVLRWFTSHTSTGVLEGINSLIQAAKAKARGYRHVENLITMAYLIAGHLRLNVPAFR